MDNVEFFFWMYRILSYRREPFYDQVQIGGQGTKYITNCIHLFLLYRFTFIVMVELLYVVEKKYFYFTSFHSNCFLRRESFPEKKSHGLVPCGPGFRIVAIIRELFHPTEGHSGQDKKNISSYKLGTTHWYETFFVCVRSDWSLNGQDQTIWYHSNYMTVLKRLIK